MATGEESQHRETNNNTKDIDHVDKPIESNPIYDQLFNLGVTLTSNKLGQYVVRKIDRLLWAIENTAKWSVPQNINESESAVPPPPLIRPLNWFLFIPALIVMRLFRAGASFVLLMFGYDALAPITMVQILQKQRRVLRAIRYQGLKTIRSRNAENQKSGKNSLLSIVVSSVSGIFCSGGNLEEPVKIVVKSNNRPEGHASKKRLLSDEDECNKNDENDLNLTCADLLDKYGSISSCDDSDFEPDAIDDETSSDSSEESEPEGRTEKDEVDVDDEEEADAPVEAEKGEEPKATSAEANTTSEPVEIIQNTNKSPVPPEEHNHSAIYDSGDSHQSNPPAKFYHNQPHNFNHNQPPRQAANHFNFHYQQHNSHQPSHQNHNLSFNTTAFLAQEKLHDRPHHMNGNSNNQNHHEPKIHHVPSSLSPTSSTSSSTTNVSSAQAGSTTAADNSIPRKKTQTKYNKYQKNRYYSGGNKQNSKKNSY